MSRVVILMPYRHQDAWREMAFGAANLQAHGTGWDVYEGCDDSEPFSIARSWNKLARRADADGRWDIAIRWAADMLIADTESLRAAVETATCYVRPYDEATRLTEAETTAHYSTGHIPDRTDKDLFGGISVNTRDCWDKVGGFDPRFTGWGHEDRAYLHGVDVHYGGTDPRGHGRLINLWHPRPPADGAYMRRRGPNLAMLRAVQEIRTPEAWAEHVAVRGRQAPES